jgi:hypothetical protein
MPREWLKLIFFSSALLACLLCVPVHLRAQQTKDKWQRVYTGDESVIELNASSLRFKSDYILRVQIRTVMSHPETIERTSAAKYKTRLETIDFKLNDRRYRMFETSLLDSGGKELQSYATSEMRDWRVLKSGGIMERLFYAASALPPFGAWKVVAYRSPNEDLTKSRPKELEMLIGVRVQLQSNRAVVGMDLCSLPAYEDKDSLSEDVYGELTGALKSIGIQPEADLISLTCKVGAWRPPQSLVVRVREGEMLMLWQGVFLVLKREGELPRNDGLRRRQPLKPE